MCEVRAVAVARDFSLATANMMFDGMQRHQCWLRKFSSSNHLGSRSFFVNGKKTLEILKIMRRGYVFRSPTQFLKGGGQHNVLPFGYDFQMPLE